MRKSQWIISLFLATSLCTAAIAADATPAKKAELEKIDGTPAAAKHDMKDCPVNHKEKDCNHKNGEPCPFEQGVKQQGKMQDKCDYKKRG